MRFRRVMLVPGAVLLVLPACSPRCPIWSPEGKMIERNLMEHVYYTYRQAAVALGDHQTAEAYQQLGQLLALLRLVPEEEPRRSALAEEAREGVEKAMAALRIGDIFAARDGARLAGPFCMSYRTMRPSRAAPSETGPSP